MFDFCMGFFPLNSLKCDSVFTTLFFDALYISDVSLLVTKFTMGCIGKRVLYMWSKFDLKRIQDKRKNDIFLYAHL